MANRGLPSLNKGKGILFEEDDEPIQIPEQDTSRLIQEYGLSLIGKVLNPKKQDVEKLIGFMPQHWGLEGRLTANDLGSGRFLFNFVSDEDLQSVLDRGPFHYNFWMFVLVRWEPIVHDQYPWEITFWIQLTGIPLHFWLEQTMQTIGKKLGFVHKVEEMEARLQITFDCRKPLRFSRKIQFHNGDDATIQINYERLFKFCSYCGLLTHEAVSCSSREADLAANDQDHRPGIFARLHDDRKPLTTHSDERAVKESQRELVVATRPSDFEKRGRYDRGLVPVSRGYTDREDEERNHSTRHHRGWDPEYLQRKASRYGNHSHQSDVQVEERSSKTRRDQDFNDKGKGFRSVSESRGRLVGENLRALKKPSSLESHSQPKDFREAPRNEITHVADLLGVQQHLVGSFTPKDKLPTDALMIDALSNEEADFNDDNDDLLGEDCAAEKVRLGSNTISASASKEDSLNETLQTIKSKVKPKVHKTSAGQLRRKPPSPGQKSSKNVISLGIHNKKAEILRRGSPKRKSSHVSVSSLEEAQVLKTSGPTIMSSKAAKVLFSDSKSGSVVYQKPPSSHQ